jgi:transglutaminase/protease-like cytokinesis protein 3
VTDASGNETELTTQVVVVNDLTPPQITLLAPLYVELNEPSPDYWAYTEITDAKSGLDTTAIDDSGVVLDQLGTSVVLLKATDKDGNQTIVERPVVVAAKATVLTMNGMADPLNQKASDYAKEVYADLVTASMTDRQKLRAIYDFLLDEMSYRTDNSNDYNIDSNNKIDEYAKFAFENMVGNCFYYASMAAELIQEGGFEVTLIKGEGYSQTEPDHFLLHYWLIVRVDGKLYHFDPLYEQLYKGKRQFFLVTDSTIYGSSHRWIKADYPATN